MRAERLDLLGGDGWRALVGVRKGLVLLVTGSGQADEVDVEAWSGEPGKSAGVAVIEAGGGSLQVARVALCGCGDRGCGNAGVQFCTRLAGRELPVLVELVRELPWAGVTPTPSNVSRGDGLAAVGGSAGDPAPRGPSYAYSPLTGRSWPPRR